MNLHEYQAKQLFAAYGLPVSTGYACDTPEEVAEKTAAIGGNRWVVKAQVHAGGRGKAGGVKLVDVLQKTAPAADHKAGSICIFRKPFTPVPAHGRDFSNGIAAFGE